MLAFLLLKISYLIKPNKYKNTAPMAIGAMMLLVMRQHLKPASFKPSSSCTWSFFITYPVNSAIIKPPSGSNIVEVSLSRVSKIFRPNTILISLQSLNESATATPSTQTTIPSMMADCMRVICVFSVIHAIAGSTREIEDVHVEEGRMTKGKTDPSKIDPLLLWMPEGPYLALGEKVADAYKVGKEYRRKVKD